MGALDGRGFESVTLVYDGECPLCSRYATYHRLRQVAQVVELIDARTMSRELWGALADAGVDINEGVVIRTVDAGSRVEFWSGHAAVGFLAGFDENPGLVGWLHRSLRTPWLVRIIYPLLYLGRKVLLLTKGVAAEIHPAS